MSSYNESDPCPFDLDQSTPTEGATPPSEVNNAIREIKRAFKNVNRIKTVTAATTLTEEDNCAICSSSGPFTLKLPLIANVCNATMTKPYEVYNIGSATVTVSGNGASLNDATQLELSQQYGGYRMLPDGTQWNIQGKVLNSPTISGSPTITGLTDLSVDGTIAASNFATPVNVDGTVAASNFVGGAFAGDSAAVDGTVAASNFVGGFDAITDQGGGNNLLCKVIDIGDWNMDATTSVGIAHGLSNRKKTRSIDVIVRDDADSIYIKLEAQDPSTPGVGGSQGHINQASSTNITLSRITGGYFDSALYDSTSYNRGWIIIWYTE